MPRDAKFLALVFFRLSEGCKFWPPGEGCLVISFWERLFSLHPEPRLVPLWDECFGLASWFAGWLQLILPLRVSIFRGSGFTLGSPIHLLPWWCMAPQDSLKPLTTHYHQMLTGQLCSSVPPQYLCIFAILLVWNSGISCQLSPSFKKIFVIHLSILFRWGFSIRCFWIFSP